jgi:hypothetical protein
MSGVPVVDLKGNPVFPDGWRHAAIEGVQPSLVEALSDADRIAFDALAAERRALAEHLRERGADDDASGGDRTPSTVSVGGGGRIITEAVAVFVESATLVVVTLKVPAIRPAV